MLRNIHRIALVGLCFLRILLSRDHGVSLNGKTIWPKVRHVPERGGGLGLSAGPAPLCPLKACRLMVPAG